MIHFVVPGAQAFAIHDFLADWGGVLAPRFSIRHYEDFVASRCRVGIDYSIHDGRVVTWEFNLNPTITRRPGRPPRLPAELRPLRDTTRAAWSSGMIEGFEAIDPGETGLPEIPLTIRGPALGGTDLLRSHDAEIRGGVLRKLLRPFKPAVIRVVRAVSPLLVRAVRRSK